ncbi:hypothetical protein [Shewanella holmiensis]|uniref:Uncharacterized protein n=1 Tax=Shewanella holmiensis TaxID=2952222 RepID=A0A9X2WKY9_9GAMM|nr:hypothetical protein [Shewanella holmiensis]MCT7941331.1 hypothetical protein [Shewanella holmiensis]
MIEFTDSFSQACVAEACAAFPDLRKRLMVELILPMFARPLDPAGNQAGKPIVKPNSYLQKTVLFVAARDLIDHLPKEIGFCRFTCHCNEHGQPTDVWQRTINGVYYNHGDNQQPNWCVHT